MASDPQREPLTCSAATGEKHRGLLYRDVHERTHADPSHGRALSQRPDTRKEYACGSIHRKQVEPPCIQDSSDLGWGTCPSEAGGDAVVLIVFCRPATEAVQEGLAYYLYVRRTSIKCLHEPNRQRDPVLGGPGVQQKQTHVVFGEAHAHFRPQHFSVDAVSKNMGSRKYRGKTGGCQRRGWGMGKMGEGDGEVLTSGHKINRSRGRKVQHGEYSQ